MVNKKLGSFIIKLVVYSLVVGFLTGVLELYVGHRFILDPLLYEKDLGFVYESYLYPARWCMGLRDISFCVWTFVFPLMVVHK